MLLNPISKIVIALLAAQMFRTAVKFSKALFFSSLFLVSFYHHHRGVYLFIETVKQATQYYIIQKNRGGR